MSEINEKKLRGPAGRIAGRWSEFKSMSRRDKGRAVSDLLFNNAMYIIIAIAIIFIAIKVPAFLSMSSIVNILSLTAAKLPIALGIGGAIVLTGTDISAGRCVGLTACIAASLLQVVGYANKMFPTLGVMPLWLVFAVGSNEEAANVSGVNVFRTIVLVFVLAGAMYGITGFIEGARIASCSSNTGLNYESDAIAACVIGGVSFVGGTGRISGIVIGVLLLQIIFVGLNFLSVDANMLYVIKGLIILAACAIDMRKYLARR